MPLAQMTSCYTLPTETLWQMLSWFIFQCLLRTEQDFSGCEAPEIASYSTLYMYSWLRLGRTPVFGGRAECVAPVWRGALVGLGQHSLMRGTTLQQNIHITLTHPLITSMKPSCHKLNCLNYFSTSIHIKENLLKDTHPSESGYDLDGLSLNCF